MRILQLRSVTLTCPRLYNEFWAKSELDKCKVYWFQISCPFCWNSIFVKEKEKKYIFVLYLVLHKRKSFLSGHGRGKDAKTVFQVTWIVSCWLYWLHGLRFFRPRSTLILSCPSSINSLISPRLSRTMKWKTQKYTSVSIYFRIYYLLQENLKGKLNMGAKMEYCISHLFQVIKTLIKELTSN